MFSPATRKSHPAPDSPSTPLPDNRRHSAIPSRPTTGSPAPWSSRLSVLARIPSGRKTEKTSYTDQIQPVYVGEFPQVVRNAQANLLQKSVTDNAVLAGGMDKGTSLSWVICENQLFVWSYLSTIVSKNCVVLEIPSSAMGNINSNMKSRHVKYWLVSIVKWDIASSSGENVLGQSSSIGIVICNQKTQAVVYWPDIYSEKGSIPIVSLSTPNSIENISPGNARNVANEIQEGSWSTSDWFNSLIASGFPGSSHECIAIACQSNGGMWHLHLAPSGIHWEKVSENALSGSSVGYPQINREFARSMIWRLQHGFLEKTDRQFFLLTDREIQCWNVMLAPDANVRKLWTHEIVGTDGDLGIKKDLAGQKHIWLLDMQVDDRGKEFTILVATLCKERVSSSSYTQYSLLTMQYRPGLNISLENCGLINERVLEKKAPLQEIIPKARVEGEDFLFSMRLRIGGKPSGSAIILSGDGTATVTNYWRGSTRLYRFDLPWDAGRVLDASVLPSAEDDTEGAWVVLTEKAGIWAIPEKAVLFGGVEPPERSLSRKGSSNEGAAEEEKRSQAFGGNIVPRRASSEAWSAGAGDRQRAALTGIAQRTAQDEEAEALLGRLYHDFILSGEVDRAFEKLRSKGAFEKEGETNVFARLSKSIVDTLAKHWTTTRGADFMASAVVSSLLLDKQHKHQQYLQFLALSKCHEELSSRQRQSLLTIMEHGEKLSGMVQLRELQNLLSQSRSHDADSPSLRAQNQITGSLWTLIQLVGEKARRNTVLLMDRDNAEVFYSRVSDVEELFYCLSHHLHYIIDQDQPSLIQMQCAHEVSNASLTLIQAAVRYRDLHQTWYPSLEGLIPWNCHPVVRSGLWGIASYIMQLIKEAAVIDMSVKSDLCSQLEGLTDALLEAYTGTITTKIERGEGHRGLLEEYCHRRDELLGSLYEHAKRNVDRRYQDSWKGVEDKELKEAIFREVTSSLLLIAKRHEGYQTLWHICYDLSDTGLLRSLMHDSRGPKGGFCYFVFRQLIKSHQYAKLLRLGEEFQEELANFLKENKELLWLHEIFLNRFSSASETLHALALSQDDGSVLVNAEEPEPSQTKRTVSLADRKRLLNLSKIAAVAGRGPDFEIKINRIEADLRILQLQEVVARRSPEIAGRPEDINRPLPPGELIEMCLKENDRDLSLQAFEIFAWTSSSFRSSNKSLLEDCWRHAANQDNWVDFCQTSTTEGWSDEVILEYLKETVLFKASRQCYGPEAETYDGSFEEVLALNKEDAELLTVNDANTSVEEILMQHKDFPDAGKLMLTTIMMGKLGTHVLTEEDMAMDS